MNLMSITITFTRKEAAQLHHAVAGWLDGTCEGEKAAELDAGVWTRGTTSAAAKKLRAALETKADRKRETLRVKRLLEYQFNTPAQKGRATK
jgi:hypothetical protein